MSDCQSLCPCRGLAKSQKKVFYCAYHKILFYILGQSREEWVFRQSIWEWWTVVLAPAPSLKPATTAKASLQISWASWERGVTIDRNHLLREPPQSWSNWGILEGDQGGLSPEYPEPINLCRPLFYQYSKEIPNKTTWNVRLSFTVYILCLSTEIWKLQRERRAREFLYVFHNLP